MKKLLITILALSILLLSACGGKTAVSEPSVSVSSEENMVEVSAALEEAAAEVSVAEESAPDEPDTSSPEALARWLWEHGAAEDESYAVDCDMEIDITVEIDGEITSESVTSRIREIRGEDGSLVAQTTAELGNKVTEIWYEDGTVYYSGEIGNYKAPMDVETYIEEYGNDTERVEGLGTLTAEDFGILTAEETETGYMITYGQISVEAWSAFTSILDATMEDMEELEDADVSYEIQNIEGTINLDKELNLTGQNLIMEVAADIMGIEMLEKVEVHQNVNCRNEAVSIMVPSDDDSYKEVSDIKIPELFINGYTSLASLTGIQYTNALALTVTDGEVTEVFTYEDDIYCVSTLEGVNYQWNTSMGYNGELIEYVEDVYSSGEGVVTDSTGSYPYEYDDESTLADVYYYLTAYSDTLEYGSDFVLSDDNGMQKLEFKLDPVEYCEPILDSNLQTELGLSTVDAMEITIDGKISLWYNEYGILVSQLLEINSTLTYAGSTLEVTLMDGGDLVAANESVVFPAE